MYIKIKAIAGAKREKIEKKSDDHYVVSIKEKAERNMANNRIKEIMAEQFGVSVGSVRIVNGHQSPSKILSINLS